MTLQVEFNQFVDAAKRHLKSPIVYVSRRESRTWVTAAEPDQNTLIACSSKLSVEEVTLKLSEDGFEVQRGTWLDAAQLVSEEFNEPPHVAAVAYKSGDETPGIWVDAFADLPTPAMVLKALYEEFRQTGEVGEMSFEEFVRMANPNVVIVTPKELDRFLADKEEGC